MSSAQQPLSKLRLRRGIRFSSSKIGKCSSKNSPIGLKYIVFWATDCIIG